MGKSCTSFKRCTSVKHICVIPARDRRKRLNKRQNPCYQENRADVPGPLRHFAGAETETERYLVTAIHSPPSKRLFAPPVSVKEKDEIELKFFLHLKNKKLQYRIFQFIGLANYLENFRLGIQFLS